MPMITLKMDEGFNSYDEERLLEWIEQQGYKYDVMSEVEQ
jgi:hypothetical protein